MCAGVDLHRAPQGDVRGDGLAQLEDTRRGGVAVMAVAQGLHRRLHHVPGGLEVRLPDAEVDDVAALPGEGIGAGEHLERGFGPEPGHLVRKSKHGVVLPSSCNRRMNVVAFATR